MRPGNKRLGYTSDLDVTCNLTTCDLADLLCSQSRTHKLRITNWDLRSIAKSPHIIVFISLVKFIWFLRDGLVKAVKLNVSK